MSRFEKMRKESVPLITLSSDFGPGNIGCGAMEAAVFEICPEAKVIHWCHTTHGFDIKGGARNLEGVYKISVGFHVGVVDPGVGTKRRGIAIETKRGDFLIGPDNGLLRPAAEFLEGIVGAWELTHANYHRKNISPIFHGRDIFAPVAAHLANGVAPKELGPTIDVQTLVASPYPEATWKNGELECEVIHINENGSCFLNVRAEEFKKAIRFGKKVSYSTCYHMLFSKTFGEVPKGDPLILPDDFGRIELAINQGSFALAFGIKRGDKLLLKKG